MTKRKELLEWIRLKVADGDDQGALRIYVENRCIGYSAFQDASFDGRRLKERLNGRKTSETLVKDL